jgi:hypothetical protein
MATPDNNVNAAEDNDKNKQEPHDPAAAGKAAIEAGKIADPKNNEATEATEKEDAEKWRNEG